MILVEKCRANSDFRYFKFRNIITGHFIWHAGSEAILENHHPTLKLLTEIPGVQGILLWEGYQVNITKAGAYTWDELIPRILTILELHDNSQIS